MKRLLWERKFDLTELSEVAKQIATEISKQTPFCLWLQGNLGAGKTALTREIFYAMGLPREESVTSPTFTLLNEYEVQERWYAHLDLYRLSAVEDFDLSYRDFQGYFLEWPKEVETGNALAATHLVEISNDPDDLQVRYLRFFELFDQI